MAAIWYRARAELRARRRATVLLGVTVGLLAGASVAAGAGARRTNSAYPRFVERYGVYDLSIGVGELPGAADIFDRIERLPMVEATSRSSFFFARVRAPSGLELSFPEVFVVAERARSGPALQPVKVVEGRLYDPAAADEVIVGYALAERLSVRAGDTLQVTFVEAFGGDGVARDVSVAGIVALVGGFETLNGSGFPSFVGAGPAYFDAYRRFTPDTDANLSVRLRNREADIPAFRGELQRLGIPFDTITHHSSFTQDVLALNRVPAVAAWALCLLLAVAAVAITGQAVARETIVASDDAEVLRAVGFARGGFAAVAAVRSAVIAAIGAVLAVAISVSLSPLTPLGVARIAEPDPGFAVDALALGLGALVTLVLTVAAGVVPARRLGRARAAGARVPRGLGAVSTAVPPSVGAGIRLAFDRGRGRRAVPVREAVVGMALAVAAVGSATVFDESLGRLLDDHSLSGYRWDAGAVAGAPGALDAIEARLPGDLVAQSWRGTVFPLVEVDGTTIDLVTGERPMHSIVDGRAPAAPDEIVLDRRTLAGLGKRIGDTVAVRAPDGSPSRAFEVVGTFVVQRLPFQPELPGRGAGVTPDGQRAIQGEALYEAVYVRFVPGVELAAGASRLRRAVGEAAFAVLSPLQAGGASTFRRMSNVPLVLTGVFAIVAVATLLHALSVTVGRRRRDLAVLRTLGFTRGQLRMTVGCQCTVLVALALAIGIPAGAIAGRWGWRLFANEIGVVPFPVVNSQLVGIALMWLVLANVVAALPARAAARTRVAEVLRTE